MSGLRVIRTWGEKPKPLPENMCINLTGNIGWTRLTKTSKGLHVGKESIIEIDLNDIPTSKREEEAVEIPEDQLGDEEVCGATGRVEMIPDETLDDPDTESIGFFRKMITHLDGDVLTPVGTFSKREAVEEEHMVEI